jgi:CheY-like chemotaxis protein
MYGFLWMSARGRNAKPVTILAVDDFAEELVLTRVALERTGLSHRLSTLIDGDEAVAYLKGTGRFKDRTYYPFPDVMLLALKMPRLSGFDVLQVARSTRGAPHLLICVLSRSELEGDINRAYALGANAYLFKPETLAQRSMMFESLLNFHAVISHKQRPRRRGTEHGPHTTRPQTGMRACRAVA